MIITKEDIGRKAVSRNGRIWTICETTNNKRYSFLLTDSKLGSEIEVDSTGSFWGNGESSALDIIRWAHETEYAQ
jgi:hypothetical protein